MSNKKLTVKQWCDQQVEEGKELFLKWEGGNDSGYVHFEIDGETVENEYTEELVNYCYKELDYGSWAGDFDANGEAIYDPKTGSFSGIDYYRESSTVPVKLGTILTIPKDLWFERVEINIEDYNADSYLNVDVKFIVNNGFTTENHETTAAELGKQFSSEITEAINTNLSEDDVRGIWFNESYTPATLDIDAKGNYVLEIEDIDIGTYETDEKNVTIFINDENNEDEEKA